MMYKCYAFNKFLKFGFVWRLISFRKSWYVQEIASGPHRQRGQRTSQTKEENLQGNQYEVEEGQGAIILFKGESLEEVRDGPIGQHG